MPPKHTRRKFLQLSGTAAVAVSLSGCIGDDDPEPDPADTPTPTPEDSEPSEPDTGGSLVYGVANHASTLDPQASVVGNDEIKIMDNIYDKLVHLVPGTIELKGGLAVDWDIDETLLTFTIREGVSFHNGDELTAEDVVATYRRFTDPDYEYYAGADYVLGAANMNYAGHIESFEATGEFEVTIELQQSYSPMIRNMAWFPMNIMPKELIESDWDLAREPVGTGPFALSDFDDGNRLVRLAANEEYWDDGPFVDEVIFNTIDATSTRAQSLRSEESHIIDGLDASGVQLVADADNAEILQQPGINIGFMALNMGSFEPFRDKRVRQAISHAIDKESIIENLYGGVAEVANQPIPPPALGHNSDLGTYEYDPERAQDLLNEAGYEDGFSFELSTFQTAREYNTNPIQTAETIRSNLGDVGIDVEIRQMDWASFFTFVQTGEHEACMIGMVGSNSDSELFYFTILHPFLPPEDIPEDQDWVSHDTEGASPFNYAAWANREYMSLVEDSQRVFDEEDRQSILEEAMEIAHEEAPWVYLNNMEKILGVANVVDDFVMSAEVAEYLHLVQLQA